MQERIKVRGKTKQRVRLRTLEREDAVLGCEGRSAVLGKSKVISLTGHLKGRSQGVKGGYRLCSSSSSSNLESHPKEKVPSKTLPPRWHL